MTKVTNCPYNVYSWADCWADVTVYLSTLAENFSILQSVL